MKNNFKVLGKCDDCNINEAIASYPSLDQAKGTGGKMAGIFPAKHKAETGHTGGYIRLIGTQGENLDKINTKEGSY